jgi:hypothetical protein
MSLQIQSFRTAFALHRREGRQRRRTPRDMTPILKAINITSHGIT